jgi:hypothetical protein
MEALGLVDAIITTIADAPTKSFSKTKVIVDREQVIEMLEKLRLVLQKGSDIVRKSVTMNPDEEYQRKTRRIAEVNPELFGLEGEALIRQAKDESERIRQEADEYARNVLTNLQVGITKMMRTIEVNKERLSKYKEKDKIQ